MPVMDSSGSSRGGLASKNKLKRKTIYSPVGRHPSDLAPIESHPTLAKLRYLDDDDEDEDVDNLETSGEDVHHQEAITSNYNKQFEKCTGNNMHKVHRRYDEDESLHRRRDEHQFINEPPPMRDSISSTSNSEDRNQNNRAKNIIGVSNSRHQQQQQQQHDSNDDAASLEEVYLCTCCGVTKPLDPAMKLMPLFKSLFLFANFLVFSLGLASLGMGLWFRIDPKIYEIHKYIETQNYTIAGWLMLFTGFIACLLALAAFACILRHSICLLISYAVTMTILTLSSISSLVLLTVYGFGASLERFMSKEIYEQIRRRTMTTELDLSVSSDAAQFLDFIQVKLRCCGAQDFRDYQKLGMVIPTTCYTIAANYINAPGCGLALRRLFDLRAGLAAGLLAGGIVVQIAAIVLASLMVCSIYNWRASSRPASVAAYQHHQEASGTTTTIRPNSQ